MVRRFDEIPSPPGHWLAGHMSMVHKDVFKFFTDCKTEYGDIVRTRFWTVPGLQLTHPDDVHELFVRRNHALKKPIDFWILRWLVGRGLLTSEGETWRRQRRLIQPTFAADRIRQLGDVVLAQTVEHLQRWSPTPSMDVAHEMWQISLRIAAQAFLGSDLERDARVVGDALDHFMDEFERLWTSSTVPIPTFKTLRALGSRRRLNRVIYRLIRAKRASPVGEDLLAHLVTAGEGDDRLSDHEVRDQVVTLLLAGHETTALTVSYALMLLAQNPQRQDELYKALPLTTDDLVALEPARRVVPPLRDDLDRAARLVGTAALGMERVPRADGLLVRAERGELDG
ncbi:MAG: cytochrome P450, partial [Myxococcota bacterium]